MDEQSRFKSWVAVFTAGMDLVLFFLISYGVLEKIGLSTEKWQTMVGLIIVVGTNIFAAFNNPTESKRY